MMDGGPLRRVWSVGTVGVWIDEEAGFAVVWCNACGRCVFLTDARLSVDILQQAASDHVGAHARTDGERG